MGERIFPQNVNPLSGEEMDDLRDVMGGREFVCVTMGPDGKAFCQISAELNVNRDLAAEIMRLSAGLLDGRHPDRIRQMERDE